MTEIEEQFYTALRQLERSYERNEYATWSACCIAGCADAAPGGGECADCCEAKLTEIIGEKALASILRLNIERKHQFIKDALKLIKKIIK